MALRRARVLLPHDHTSRHYDAGHLLVENMVGTWLLVTAIPFKV